MHILIQQMPANLLLVVDLSNSDQGETSQVAVHEHRLSIGVANDAYAAETVKTVQFTFKLAPEIIVLKVVDGPEKSVFKAVGCHSGAACSQM